MKLLIKAIVTTVIGTGIIGTGALLYAEGKPEEILGAATTIKASIDEDHQSVLRLQAKAKESKDLIQLNCVNDKLVIMNGQMNVADAMFVSLKGGVGTLAEFQTQAETIHKIAEDAKGCIDSKRLSTEASNSFSTNGYIPPITDDEGENNDLENPGYASPDD